MPDQETSRTFLLQAAERIGIPTVILGVIVYLGYVEIIRPLANRYATFLEDVSDADQEIKNALLMHGEAHRVTLKELDEKMDRILKILEAKP